MTNYEILSNKEWTLKTIVTSEIDIDLSSTVKNVVQTRTEFLAAWYSIVASVKLMKQAIVLQKDQEELLLAVKEFTGKDLRLPTLEMPFDVEAVESEFEAFKNSEMKRNSDSIAKMQKDNEAKAAKVDSNVAGEKEDNAE